MKKTGFHASLVLAAAIAAIGCTAPTPAAVGVGVGELNTANDVSLDAGDANWYGNFAPELADSLARAPQLDPETGLFVEEIKPGLFWVTEGVYQSAFLKTGQGIIVFDAPPSFAHKLPDAIRQHAPNESVTHLVYSHGHADHVGGAAAFSEVPGLQVIAQEDAAETIRKKSNPGILLPTLTFEDQYTLSLGSERVELKSASFHSEDADTLIYLPDLRFIMAVDTITPGEVPFMGFGATARIGQYLRFFDEVLAYDFDVVLSGHVAVLGTRADWIEAKEYVFDVEHAALKGMQTFNDRFNDTFATFEYQNANLAYRRAIESVRAECAAEIIDRWKERLSVVDVWGDSHCEEMILYYVMH